ncbi:MAG: Hsp20/alpha crystallin family protein [Lachnospiraceae bacterium]|nr:Hsp20/alpha crystallin family protein [Lachnospiraceae bacterium]
MLRPSIFRSNFMDNVFDDFFQNPFWSDNRMSAAGAMNTDITESADGYQIEMDLPGFAKEDVKAELKDGCLTIEAVHNQEKEDRDQKDKVIRRERYRGVCRRSFYVGEQITEEDIQAKFKDGVLTLMVPKKEKQPEVEQKKYIPIEGE